MCISMRNLGLGKVLVQKYWGRCLGSGCRSVGWAVASNTRDPWFQSSHPKLYIEHLFTVNKCWKDENKEKEAGMAHFKNKNRT